MKRIAFTIAGAAAAVLALAAGASLADSPRFRGGDGYHASGIVGQVREGTRRYRDVDAASADGYALFLGCVSSANAGAMGVHFVNGGLVGDGALDASRPEALVYEPKNGELRLAAAEFVVLADAWHAGHTEPPILLGQSFHYTGSPNRYGLPPFYALHVWAWKPNRLGTFVNWNPDVSCEEYAGPAD